ncbi:MAG: CbtA family protein [Pararhizobium sp.]
MIAKTLLAAIAAGLIAGVLMTGIQQVRLVPLIEQAEIYEHGGGHAHAAALDHDGWRLVAPAEAHDMTAGAEDGHMLFGMDRHVGALLANLVVGAGYALLLAAIMLLTGNQITLRNGVLWGGAAWIAVHLMPSLGLPPELPGLPVADLTARQVWWASTVIASGAGLYILALRREAWAKALGVVLVAAPQLVGAPQPESIESAVPAILAAEFAVGALASALFFWVVLGLGMGALMDRVARSEPEAARLA